MNYKNHLKAGFYMVLAFIIILPIFRNIQWTFLKMALVPVAIFFGSQFPDLDIWSSRIRKYTFSLLFITLMVIGILSIEANFSLIAIGLFGVMVIYSIHRKVFHTALFGVVASIPIALYDFHIAMIFLIAFMTHIGTDYLVSKAKRQSKAFLKKHKTIASMLEKIGLVKLKEEYQVKWFNKL